MPGGSDSLVLMESSARRWVIGSVTAGVIAAATPLYLLYRPGSAYLHAQEVAAQASRAASSPPPASDQPSPFADTLARVQAFVTHVQAGRFDAAYAMMSPGFRAGVTLPRFRAAVAGNAYLTRARGQTLFRSHAFGRVRELEGTLHSDVGDAKLVVFESLEGTAAWTFTGLQIGGVPAFPAADVDPPLRDPRASAPRHRAIGRPPSAPAPTP